MLPEKDAVLPKMLATVSPVVDAFVEDANVAKSEVPVAEPNERLVVVAKLAKRFEVEAVVTERVDPTVPVALMNVRLEVEARQIRRSNKKR